MTAVLRRRCSSSSVWCWSNINSNKTNKGSEVGKSERAAAEQTQAAAPAQPTSDIPLDIRAGGGGIGRHARFTLRVVVPNRAYGFKSRPRYNIPEGRLKSVALIC